jgi:aminopeptidase-like protein
MLTGGEMHALVERLYPLCRSITGDGVRQTLAIVGEHLDLKVHEVPTGTQVLDWTVPQEWNVRDAYVADASGRRVIDFRESNLHVVGYSVPVDETMSLAELRGRLHTLPESPSWVPYRTSYYSPTWGFCVAQDVLDALPEGDYHVKIDSTLADGSLTYGEHVVPGEVGDEVIVSCHVCHPSLANDNLAGIAVAVSLAQGLAVEKPHFTYRFLFMPGTIGAITWLARNAEHVDRVKHGVVLACAGDRGSLTYKRSRRGDADIDRVMAYVLKDKPHEIREFSPYGYDERQFCSPGFNLGVGSLTRTPYAGYPEYHTSADNPAFVSPEAMEDTLDTLQTAFSVLERTAAT